MVPMCNYFGLNSNTSGMMYIENSGIINNVCDPITRSQPNTASGSSLLLDSIPGMRHDERLVVEWSIDEKCKLEEGLIKYANEPSIMKYVKIVATLHDKTICHVALRGRWMAVTSLKPKEHMIKKVNNRKYNLVP
ncbi:hypothetical protein E2542_SST05381 [Spatholobus suberectus]|nr:hypothetical protein E2542_SST05381 [Spatholobus suberectus]